MLGMALPLQRQGDGFTVNRAGARDRMPVGTTLADVNPHGLHNAGLRLFDGLPKTVDPWEVLAVSIVPAAFALHRDRIGIKLHSCNTITI